MDKQWEATWIMDRSFEGLAPLNLYHKELETGSVQLHRNDLNNHHMFARKQFILEGCPSAAYLDITGDDYYKVYINGRFVGQGPAQGNHFHYYYNQFEISKFLKSGPNAIAVHVYYHGLICHSYFSGDYRQGLIAELIIDDQIKLKTDHTWKYLITEEYGKGHVIAYDTQFAENIDSRMQAYGWREVGFDDSAWSYAAEYMQDNHQLYLQPTPSLSVYEIPPIQVTTLAGAGFLIDFGHEITGQFCMKAKGESGQIVEIRCGEELSDGNRVRYDMRCNCLYQDYWTLSGRDDDVLELFDYKAFRYVEVFADPNVALDTGSFSAIVRHYPFDEKSCLFESSNPLLNAIWSMCSKTIQYGAQENYVDCPSREKGQYLGDNTVITHAHAYLAGDLRLFRKSLLDFAILSTRVCPGIMAVTSGSYMQEIADFSFQWPLQLMQYYKQSGDLDFLKDMYPIAENMLAHFARYRREDGLLAKVSDKWNLVDWPEAMRDGYDFKLDYPIGDGCHNVINAFYYGAMTCVSDIEKIVNGFIAETTLERLARTKAGYYKAFFNETKMLFVDAEGSAHVSLHSNALPLLFNLVPTEAVQAVVDFLRQKRLSCGVYMAYFVLKALAKADEHALVYELITSDDLHSWANMLKEGATTCFEVWSKDLKPNASLCHPWASAPISVLIEDIIGLKPAVPGWKEVEFSPHLPDSLLNIKLRFRTPAGDILFEYKDGQRKLTVPEGVTIVEPIINTR